MATNQLASRPGAFPLLWSANALSNLGDGLYQFALPLLALATTQSPALVSGVTVTLTLAWPLFGLHAGAIVDRFDRRSILLLVSGLRFSVLALLSVAIVGGWLSLPMIYAAAAVLGLGETLADTGLTALVPSVVGPDGLERANARIVAGQTVTNSFLGPPLAGVLLGIGGGAVTGVGAALYGLTAVALAVLRGAPGAPRETDARPAPPRNRGLTAGFRFLWNHPLLRRLTLLTAAMNVWWAGFYALIVVYAVAPGPMNLQPAELGVLIAAMAGGGLAGSLVTERLVTAIGLKATLGLDLVGTALLVGTPAITTNPILVGLAMAAAGFGSAAWVILVGSIRQRLTPNNLLGRSYSASRLISWGVLPIGAAAAGLAAEVLGIRVVFAAGALTSVALLVGFVAFVRTSELSAHASPAT